MAIHCAILDDYQNVALKLADWGKVKDRVEIKVFQEHLGGPDKVIAALQGFQVIVAMRERTAFPKKVLDALPDAPKQTDETEAGPRRVALLGRPNVGKSSLLNKLAGHQRALVDAAAGTTRDPVDELIELGGTTWRFVDTAGIRRRFRENQGADYYAALRTAGALDRAEVAVVLVDASEPLTEEFLARRRARKRA